MEIFEITGFSGGVNRSGVNFLQPSEAFEDIHNGFIHRQVLQSRKGFARFGSNGLSDGTRVLGIFEHTKLDNTTETLAITTAYLYKYVEGSNSWSQIPMAGAMTGLSFSIPDSDQYVSGTSYPDGAGGDRFVFCSSGLAQIYYYNGTNVKQWNLLADNPSFEDFASVLTSARYVTRYGERINFFSPTLGGQPQPQTVLYSGIRSGAGALFKGDKFNVAGAGSLAADTSDYISGIAIMADTVVINYSGGNYTLQKTSDAFNPYFIKRLSSTIGTEAPFSTVAWGNEVRSIGRSGIISTDLRETSRIDDKIPRFTTDEIDPIKFTQTYGGYNRTNSQFLWSYVSATAEDSTEQDRILVGNYEENSWSTYNARFSVFGLSENGEVIPWDEVDEVFHTEHPEWATWDTTEDIWNKLGILDETVKTLAGDEDGQIYILDRTEDDYTEAITGITQANPAVITVASHNIDVGDEVTVSGVVGLVDSNGVSQINNFDPADPKQVFLPYTVTAVTSTKITINVDTSGTDSTWSSGGLVSRLIEFKAKSVPFNPYRSQGRKVYVSEIEFLIDTSGGFLEVDLYADEEETPFKPGVIASTVTSTKRRQWITISVNNESEFLTMRLRQKTPALNLKITSIRIHASPGGLTSG